VAVGERAANVHGQWSVQLSATAGNGTHVNVRSGHANSKKDGDGNLNVLRRHDDVPTLVNLDLVGPDAGRPPAQSKEAVMFGLLK